jgi:hypothetical protein
MKQLMTMTFEDADDSYSFILSFRVSEVKTKRIVPFFLA